MKVFHDFGFGPLPGSLPTNGTPFLHVAGPDGPHTGRVLIEGWGGHMVYSGRRANGTRVNPLALNAGDSLTAFNAFGYGTTDYCLVGAVGMDFRTAEAWTDTAQGTRIVWSTTPKGKTAAQRVDCMALSDAGYLGVGIGALNPDARLHLSDNTVPAAPALPGTIIHAQGADGGFCRELLDAYGGNVQFAGRRANGTAAAPTALLAGDLIVCMSAFGRGATAYSTSVRGAVLIFAAAEWTDTSQPTRTVVRTTPVGSTTAVDRLAVEQDGSITLSGRLVMTASGHPVLREYEHDALPSPIPAWQQIGVMDDSGARFPAYSDGSAWRRFSDDSTI